MTRKTKNESVIRNQTKEKHFDNLKEVRKTADHVRSFISIVGLLLGGTFTIAKLSGIPVIQVSSDDWSRFFLQTAIIIYFWSYIRGSKSDLNSQEGAVRVLEVPKARIYSLLASCAGLVAIFFILWRISTFAMFSVALVAFLALDLGLYFLYYNKVLKKQFNNLYNRLSDAGEIMSAQKVTIVDDYMKGRWRYYRWAFGFVWIFTFLILDASGEADSLASLTGIFSASSFSAFSVLVFVLIMEGWQWAYRMKLLGKIHLLEELGTKFDLNFKKSP